MLRMQKYSSSVLVSWEKDLQGDDGIVNAHVTLMYSNEDTSPCILLVVWSGEQQRSRYNSLLRLVATEGNLFPPDANVLLDVIVVDLDRCASC